MAGPGGAEFIVAAIVGDQAGQFAVVGVGVDDVLVLAAGGVDGGEEHVINFGAVVVLGTGENLHGTIHVIPPFNLNNVLCLTVSGRLLGL